MSVQASFIQVYQKFQLSLSAPKHKERVLFIPIFLRASSLCICSIHGFLTILLTLHQVFSSSIKKLYNSHSHIGGMILDSSSEVIFFFLSPGRIFINFSHFLGGKFCYYNVALDFCVTFFLIYKNT